MKLVRMAGLAALVALAAMAVSGMAASAAQAATQLCQENVETCPAGSIKPEGTKIKATLVPKTQATLKAENEKQEIKKVFCSKSEVTGKVGGHTENGQLLGTIENVKWEECTGEKLVNCTAGPLQLPWNMQALATEKGNGRLTTWEGAVGSGQPGGHVECSLINLNCNFKVKEKDEQLPGVEVGHLSFTGGNPAKISAIQLELKPEKPEVNPHCEINGSPIKQAWWDAEYEVVEPAQALFLTKN